MATHTHTTTLLRRRGVLKVFVPDFPTRHSQTKQPSDQLAAPEIQPEPLVDETEEEPSMMIPTTWRRVVRRR